MLVPSIHAADNSFPFQDTGEGIAYEMGTLVAVEYFRLAMGAAQGFLQAIDTEHNFYAAGKPDASTSRMLATKYTKPRAGRM